ncbi:MAG: ribonuclease Z, partial [Saprospiraceae bacterium]|nr:ribonuclease Z [Saprospiraceae bacterium]
MPWSLHILGTNAAVPMPDRHPSAQALDTPNEIFLIDCGEGTQERLSKYHIRRSRINHVFISHLHGDHIFGLPGLITSYNLFNRDEDLTLYGPQGLLRFIETILETTGILLSYTLKVLEHDTEEPYEILDTEDVCVYTLPLDHRVPTTGYLFREKVAKRRINGEAIEQFNVPYHAIPSLKNGKDWMKEDGVVIENELLTWPGRDPLSFAYCSDTRFYRRLIPMVRNVNLLYHETTFGSELSTEAHKRGHSTTEDAATIAAEAEVSQLLIGHF